MNRWYTSLDLHLATDGRAMSLLVDAAAKSLRGEEGSG